MISYTAKFLTLFALVAACYARPSFAQTAPNPPVRSVSVSGEGIVRVQPDVATVRFGIVTPNPDPAEARRLNAEASAKAMNAVRAMGIPEENIQLETLMLQPRQEWDETTRRMKDVGFEAIRNVSVRVEDLDKLPELVATVVNQGANRLNGIQYDLKDRDPVRNQALQEAARNARDKANVMASALGVSVGQVLQMTEQSFDYPRPVIMQREYMAMAKADSAAPEPDAFAAGEIEVRAVVQVTFSIQ
ncbi:MAG TPA: SIMPL domain-containing protein [Rhodothermales bacterium]|nr:SIMPL domain-containing protein [Rhodothermales bacterium]